MKKYLLRAVLLFGALLLLMATFASQLGLAHGSAWSTRRTLVLAAGVLLVALAALLQYGGLFVPRLRENRLINWLWTRRAGTLAILAALLSVVVYVFFASAGTWTSWPEHTRYYDDL